MTNLIPLTYLYRDCTQLNTRHTHTPLIDLLGAQTNAPASAWTCCCCALDSYETTLPGVSSEMGWVLWLSLGITHTLDLQEAEPKPRIGEVT